MNRKKDDQTSYLSVSNINRIEEINFVEAINGFNSDNRLNTVSFVLLFLCAYAYSRPIFNIDK